MSLRALLRRLGRRPARPAAGPAEAAAGAPALAALREEVAALARATEGLQADLDLLRRVATQSQALTDAAADAERTLAALGTSLDLARVTHHVRAAIAAAVVRDASVPCALIDGLLPEETLAAAWNAIPSDSFFPQDGTGRAVLEVPPRVAPARVVATWMFLNDVANDLLGPTLRRRLATDVPEESAASGLKLSGSRVVRIPAGASALDAAPAESWMTVLVSLGPAHPNTAMAFRGGPPVRETLRVPVSLPAADACYLWELSFVPAAPRRTARRRHGDIDSWAP